MQSYASEYGRGDRSAAAHAAAAKRNLKVKEKERKACEGDISTQLQRLLILDPNADVYLQSPAGKPLCRTPDKTPDKADKSKRRGRRANSLDDDCDAETEPALEVCYGYRTLPPRALQTPVKKAASFFEAVPDGALDVVVSALCCEADVGAVARTWRTASGRRTLAANASNRRLKASARASEAAKRASWRASEAAKRALEAAIAPAKRALWHALEAAKRASEAAVKASISRGAYEQG
ncbi:hypothetical protein M885DRAFT_556333 [Pelagophyceae sp. CCMP2097]|nr:hypothetical protein M885DRAFT_556333 [Pelagophyceae sp. CCMP2097]